MNPRSLRKKGVTVHAPRPATSPGWSLHFALTALFPHEGQMATLQPGDVPAHGVLGEVDDADMEALDRFEGRGLRYDRVPIDVVTYDGETLAAEAYVSLPQFVREGRPSRRYINLLVEGARQMGLDEAWVQRLEATPIKEQPDPGPVDPAAVPDRVVSAAELAAQPRWVALGTLVFDLSPMEPFVCQYLGGGSDATLLWLRRMDSSDGSERADDAHAGRLSPAQVAYLHLLQQDLATLGRPVGRYAP